MQIKMYLPNGEGNTIQLTSLGFIWNTKISAGMWNFEYLYKLSVWKIRNDFTEFNANWSGWILERVELISVHIARYQPIQSNYSEKGGEESERMLSGNIKLNLLLIEICKIISLCRA